MSIEQDSELLGKNAKKSKLSSAIANRIEDELNKSNLHAQERSDEMLINGAISNNNKSADTNSSHSCESGFASTGDEESAECASSTSSSSSCSIPSNEISPCIETAQMHTSENQKQQNLQKTTNTQQANQSQQQFRAVPPFLQSSQSVSIINLDGNALPESKQHSTVFENNDENLVILSTSFSSSLNSDSRPKNAMQRLMYFLCCCCRCCNVSNTIFWSWLSIFCCCCPLLGGISLYLTRRSNKLKMKQQYEKADKYSNCAEKLNIASLIFGVLFYAFAFFMVTLVIFMYWRHSNA